MKDTIRITILSFSIAGMMIISRLSPVDSATPPTREEISWRAFCNLHGYDLDTVDDNIINEYLDTWVGSVEEEQIILNNEPQL